MEPATTSAQIVAFIAAVCTDIGDRRARTAALNDLGEALLTAGRRRTAAARFREVLAGEADPYETARAEEGLAAATVEDDPAGARRRWQRALTAYARMEVPRSGEIRRRLADLRDRNVPGQDDAAKWPADR